MAIADSFGTNYLNNIRNINQAFAPVDTNLLQQQLSASGVGNTLGFGADGINTLGLTPDDIAGLVNMRGVISNQNTGLVKGVTELSDLLSGNKETRAAMTQANRDIFQAGQQQSLQDQSLAAQSRENALNRELDERQLEEQRRYHNLTIGEQKAAREQQGRLHRESLKLKRDLARISMSQSNAAIEGYQKLAQAGVPFHTPDSEKRVAGMLAKNPEKLDPTARASAMWEGISLGLLGDIGQEITIPTPTGKKTFFGGNPKFENKIYSIGVDPKTKIKGVYEKVGQDQWKFVKPVSVRIDPKSFSGRGGSGSSVSAPAFMFDDDEE